MLTGIELIQKFKHGKTTIENDILLNDTITPTEKFIYMYIEMLSFKENFCRANNEQLSDMTGQSLDSVKQALQKLKAKKYIVVDTKRTRSPVRRIFTIDRFLKMHWSNDLPKDCIIKKPPTPLKERLDREALEKSFPKFRRFMRTYLSDREFICHVPGDIHLHKILIKKNGYYRDLSTALELTNLTSVIFEQGMWDDRKTVLDDFFNNKEEEKDEKK